MDEHGVIEDLVAAAAIGLILINDQLKAATRSDAKTQSVAGAAFQKAPEWWSGVQEAFPGQCRHSAQGPMWLR